MILFLFYFVKVFLIQGVFYGLFWCFFQRNKWHHVNRLYLLLSLGASFVIPALEVFPEVDTVPKTFVNQTVALFEPIRENLSYTSEANLAQGKAVNADTLLFVLLGCFVGFFLFRWTTFIHRLRRLKGNSHRLDRPHFTLFRTPGGHPFSFFKNIFMPEVLFGSQDFGQIYVHEQAHVKQWHSIDRVLMNFAVSLFWFNPFIYLYRNALVEIHEYQADEAVVDRFQDRIGYQETLYRGLLGDGHSFWVSHFNAEMIKKRILMMNKEHKKSKGIYLLAIPVLLSALFAFSSTGVNESIASTLSIMHNVGPKLAPVQGLEELQSELDHLPWVLPLAENSKVQVSSLYGNRRSPIDQKVHHHRGIDFRVPVGTSIIATGDAQVLEIRQNPGGFGNMVVLKHGKNYVTRYAHLSEILVRKGQIVQRGDIIAKSGNSGLSTGPHLHYEVIKDGQPVDPVGYIRDYKFNVEDNNTK